MSEISIKTSEITLQIIKDNLPDNLNIKIDDKLQDLNINSITFIQIIVSLENEFDFEFEDEKLLFKEFPTVKSMVDYVISRTNVEN